VTIYLLDVNLLLKLHLPASSDHGRVTRWFSRHGSNAFATCAITQAGFVRVLTQQSLISLDPIELSEAIFSLGVLQQRPGHRFWPMDLGYIDATTKFDGRLFGHQQVTDGYLLGLAIHHKGKLATTDRRIQHIAGKEFADFVTLID
jgi:uncharacterized protein